MKDTIELCRDEGSCLIILFHTQVLMSSTVDLTILITTAWNVVLISRLLVSCLCYFVHPPWSHTEVYSEWFIHKNPTLPIKNTELKMRDTRLRHTTTTTTECTDKHTLTQGLWIKHINIKKAWQRSYVLSLLFKKIRFGAQVIWHAALHFQGRVTKSSFTRFWFHSWTNINSHAHDHRSLVLINRKQVRNALRSQIIVCFLDQKFNLKVNSGGLQKAWKPKAYVTCSALYVVVCAAGSQSTGGD